jgi:transaldolase
MNPLIELQQAGQSIWLDFITRGFMTEGKLQKLIKEDGLRGVTSNPTIFQKALSGSEYDSAIQEAVKKETPVTEIFDAVAIADIQQACDLFMPVYESTAGGDGYVSLEVNPHLARATQGTLEEVRKLFRKVNRPNVMIKIPATKEGIPAIEQSLADGININITLIFSLQRYQEVMNAWLGGLEKALKAKRSLHRIASVASFFVSRVDTMVDKMLDEKGASKELHGKAAIANAKLAYKMFQDIVASPRYKALKDQGARVQRPLWASTSTKNPSFRDVIYVEELIGPDTVNTLPPATIDAFRDHGKVRNSITENVEQAKQVLAQLKEAGVDIDQVTQKLEEDGVKSFSESYDSLINSLKEKRQAMKVTN